MNASIAVRRITIVGLRTLIVLCFLAILPALFAGFLADSGVNPLRVAVILAVIATPPSFGLLLIGLDKWLTSHPKFYPHAAVLMVVIWGALLASIGVKGVISAVHFVWIIGTNLAFGSNNPFH
ncbi:MAG: hypothetical protein EPO08_06140 [Rhodospirillaceae bacterium]|nr:MAG: hypothetical protein EPO08_06140 [Rhodospirillaceae bacterium]